MQQGLAIKVERSEEMEIENDELNIQMDKNVGDQEHSLTKTLSLRDYYTKIKGRKVACCNLCHKKVSFKMSSLRTHLKIRHMRKYTTLARHTTRRFKKQGKRKAVGKLRRQCQAVESTGTAPATSTDRLSSVGALSSEEKKTIDGILLKMIAKLYQPTHIVEAACFHDFVRTLNPNYQIPDKITIDKYYLTIYNKIKAEQNQFIKQEASDICLTIDYWTSKTSSNEFMAVTAHFVTKKFELKHVMFCVAVKAPGAKILDLRQVLKRVDNKTTSCVTEYAFDRISDIKQYRCLGHKLYLCLQKATIALKATILKVLKQDPSFVRKMFVSCETYDVFSAVTWDDVYTRIKFTARNQNASRAKLSAVTDEEWKALTQFAAIFEPFRQATLELCTEKFVSASKAIAVITGLKMLLSEVIGNKPEMYDSIREVMKILQSEMDKHFGDIENDEDITLCAALDPRYKIHIFDNDVKKKVYEDLVCKVVGVVKAQKSPNTTTTEANGEPEAGDTDTGVLDLWGHLKKSKTLRKRDPDYTDSAVLARQEVDTYFSDESCTKECDPCDWWKKNAAKYPHLSVLFRTRWQLRATSVPGKDVFFKDFGNKMRRNGLTALETPVLVFLNANLDDAEYNKYI